MRTPPSQATLQRPPLDQQITFLYADDARTAWQFYERVVGLRLVQDQGTVRIYEVAGSRAFLGICTARAPRASDDPRVEGGVCFTFVTPDVAGWHQWLTARGATMGAPPTHSTDYGIHHFFISDPAGNLLEFQRFERPGWPMPTE